MADWKPQVRRVSSGEESQFVFINALIRERRFDEAERELRAGLAEDEASYAANLAMARLYQAQRRFDQSVPYLERAMASDPMQPEAALLAGVSYYIVADVDRAVECFRVGIDLDNRLPGAHLGMALAMMRQKDHDGAIKHLREALQLDPQMMLARLMLARLLHRVGEQEAARDMLEEVAELQPDQRASVISLSILFAEQKLYDEALNLLEPFVERNPGDHMATNLMGYVKVQVADFEGAETAFRRSLESRKRPGPVAKLALIDTLIPQGKLDEAQELLGSIRVGRAQRTAVNKRYGDLFFAKGDYQKAIEYYRSIVLRGDDGAAKAERIDEEAGESDDIRARAEAYRAAVEESRESTFQKLAEVDWQSVLQRFQPALMQLWETRRQHRQAS